MSVSPTSPPPATVTTTTSSASTDASSLSENDVLQAKIAPYLDEIDLLTAESAANGTKISAYQEMQGLLQSLEDAVEALSNPLGSDNVFEDLAASFASNNSTNAADILSATIAAGTATGTHTISVTALAEAERIASGSQTSQSSALDLSGSFTIGENGSTAATITLTSDMSLSDLVSAINGQSSTTGIKASIVAVSNSASDPEYRLVLTGSDTDEPISMSQVSGTVLSSLGITGADGSTPATILQAAAPAQLMVDGIAVERPTNDIDDVLSGVTLNLTQADAATTITMSITNDTSSVESAIDTFVTSYNAWRSFVNVNQATDANTGSASSTAVLFGDSTLRDASLNIDQALNGFVGSSSLSSIGISLNSSNQLTIDSTTLESALSNNFDSVSQLFEYQAATSNADLSLVSHTGSTYNGTFTLDLTADSSGNLTGVSGTDANGNPVDFTLDGNKVVGASGTPYAGLTFFFTGSQSESITVNASQGIADQLGQATDSIANASTGSIQNIITGLQTEDADNTERSSELQTEANNYAQFLLIQYGNLEAKISQANQTQSILQEMQAAENSPS